MSLESGQIVEYGDRVYLVRMVNESRAYLVPLSGTMRAVRDGEDVREFESLGRAVNIAPTASVRVLHSSEVTGAEWRRKERMEAVTKDVAAIPVPTKRTPVGATRKQAARDRVKTREKRSAARVAKGGEPLAAKGVKNRPCCCGCGEQTGKYFVPGHDSRFKAWLARLQRGEILRSDFVEKGAGAKLPATARTVLDSYQWRKHVNPDGTKGVVPTKNYKGEPYEVPELTPRKKK